jgi:2'-hydroxyisoflavone reductase
VIDTCGYLPEQLNAMAAALGEGAPFYLYVSSISAYAGFPPHTRYDESAPLAQGNEGYGPLKARSEEAIAAALPGRVAIVRPGLIVGPHDPTGRYTYWPMRFARGGAVLAPGRPERPVQWIDARDLAAWCVHLAATRATGVFNAVGPTHTMADLLDTCRTAAGCEARLHWIDDDDLLSAGFEPWTELPLWLPEFDATHGGMLLADARRAESAGLISRPIEATVRDVLAWGRAEVRPASVATLNAEKEAAWLAAHRRS